MHRTRIGILGCGAIAPAYLKNLTTVFSPLVEVVACADLVRSLAEERARTFGLPEVMEPTALLARADVDIIINLTPAPAHYETSLSILRAGKHLFTEKPLALTRAHGRELLVTAREHGLSVAGAADTFLGGGLQAARAFLDSGQLGHPVGAFALIAIGAFGSPRYHHVFRGALLDLGPYYLTALVFLLGPVVRVTGAGPLLFPERISTRPDSEGQPFQVSQPSTSAATLEFADGTVAALLSTCDVHQYFPRVEIYGTKAAITLSDANRYAGPFQRQGHPAALLGEGEGFTQDGRGLGVVEMAWALRTGRNPQAGGDLLYHILDVMLAIHEASASGTTVRLESTVARPERFTVGHLLDGATWS